jgi:hypothetical protein
MLTEHTLFYDLNRKRRLYLEELTVTLKERMRKNYLGVR